MAQQTFFDALEDLIGEYLEAEGFEAIVEAIDSLKLRLVKLHEQSREEEWNA